ncbi:tetratricopeptide repeat protein [Halovivax gelatinilyticus]|uniref:tetratricopeptide repeat protein n=1 Tax=Halovivax gelatinilyticus TaxID=2961597 RepID=UPI0020CA7122|nr:tetratricopeptide repeat protein [Halovivax gelatinilyticus]
MVGAIPAEHTRTIIKRIEILERLCRSSAHIRDLVADTGQSRATINRAVNDLEAIDLVERSDGGVSVTVAGRLVYDHLEAFLETFEDILAAKTVLDPIPAGAEIDPALVARGEAILAGDPSPYRPLERSIDTLAEATEYRALIPTLEDPRHVRLLYEHVITDGHRADLVVTPDVFDTFTQEFPRRMAAMGETDDFSVAVGSVPPFGVSLFELESAEGGAESSTTVHLATFTDQGTLYGLLVNDAVPAVRWGETTFDRYRSEATDRTSALWPDDQNAFESGDATEFATIGRTLPGSLDHEGFSRIDASYFLNEPVADPSTAWRAGLSLTEVHTGYAISRPKEAGESSRAGDDSPDTPDQDVAASLTASLLAGENQVLLGPPGSGKSTLCKQIACDWYDDDHGPVYYRESDRGRSFTAVDELVETVTNGDGHALVVVEDAIRPNADSIFDAVDRLEATDDVSVLLDAREHEWRDRFEPAATTSEFAVTHVPPLSERDCSRLVEHFERTANRSVDVPTDELWAAVSDESATEGSTHELLRVIHRLATYADPLADGPTALEDAVSDVYDALHGDDLALSVGILVNVLNAAGVGVERGLLYTVGDPTQFDAIDAVLERLEGRVLFPRSDGRYRAVHEEWSTAFLAHLASVESEEIAARRFGSAVSELLSFADSEYQRKAIASHLDQQRALETPLEDPESWADSLVAAVYDLGRERATLAPLFGDGDHDEIELPAACAASTREDRPIWLGKLFLAGGYYDRAERAFERVGDESISRAGERRLGVARVSIERGAYDEAIDHCRACLSVIDEDDPENAVLRARAQLRLGEIQTERGSFDEAERNFERAVTVFRASGRRRWEARTHRQIGNIATKRGAFDRATEFYESSLELLTELGDRRGQAETINSMGNVAWKRGSFDRAAECFERNLDHMKALGDRHGVALALNSLGVIEGQRGKYERAQKLYEESLERSEQLGDRHGVAKCLHNLGHLETQRNNFDRAIEYYERSLERKEELGDRPRLSSTLNNIGTVEGRRGNFERAGAMHERVLEIRREHENRHGEASCLHNIGEVEFRLGSLDRAFECYERSLEIYDALDDQRGIARTYNNLGLIALRRGTDEQAEHYSEKGRERATAIEDPEQIALSHLCLSEVERRTGAIDRAGDHLEAALDAIENEDGILSLRVRLSHADLERARGEVERAESIARDVRERAASIDATYWVARADHVLGRIAFDAGTVEVAREYAISALERFEAMGAIHDAFVTLETLVDADVDWADSETYDERARALLAGAPDEVVERHEAWLSEH